uniref:Fulicin peptides n=1 Tax=Lissachatina fulica TaxID=2315439 RepID=FULI_LISFU|nr:RecName: Full=Fulicin peptides; Contains: RecName: Full=Fulicin; Contains: RecName: Full=Fucilin gene-related peptide 1; Short=FGRP-1; Contains: RecName: Full=Fucilin gene-related peptide 2; Short=FGRP-2; Contains: RecName: Full=Fucilin gene-related peptide 3; Short=FGRP-3; Contains: RecName: Full=Fucilin gene-related peptide 4; Short=FGRP-4; Contains: RecName: Full=Fucilin gene-related peptide 5; Short=FGRP-5; Contains: RecName: Full=Fucilin gene-related peptide 6; Short=FGRP-6; Contains: RecNa
MQPTVLLILMTSCLTYQVIADKPKGNHLHSRPERSPIVLFSDAPHAAASPADENDNFPVLKTANQYEDNNSATFSHLEEKHDFAEKQSTGDDEESVILNRVTGEVLSDTVDGSQGHLEPKRFNEFVGKRNTLPEEAGSFDADSQPGSLDTVRILAGLSNFGQPQIIDQGNMKNHRTLKNMIHNLYNTMNEDEASKRQYEFVGKRSYDFVGKRTYDFLGKRSPYYFLGKRYDFIGKRSPYDFIGKKNYDFVGKRSPYDFVGKRNQGVFTVSPSSTKISFDDNYLPYLSSVDAGDLSDVNKRYAEFLGKRKRTAEQDETSQRSNERLVALLQNTGFRKRLSRMLQNQRLVEHYPEFIGK